MRALPMDPYVSSAGHRHPFMPWSPWAPNSTLSRTVPPVMLSIAMLTTAPLTVFRLTSPVNPLGPLNPHGPSPSQMPNPIWFNPDCTVLSDAYDDAELDGPPMAIPAKA